MLTHVCCSNDELNYSALQSITVTLRCRSVAEASKGDGPVAASGPFILRGSQRSADALRCAHLQRRAL